MECDWARNHADDPDDECEQCDALREEIKQLKRELADCEDLAAERFDEIERLRAALGRIAGMDNERGAAMVEVAFEALANQQPRTEGVERE